MPPNKPKRPQFVGPDGSLDLQQINIPWKALAVAAVVLVLALWFGLGGPVYTVAADERGVLTTFGGYTKSSGPGLHFKLPWPVQSVQNVNVGMVRRIEIGFRSVPASTGVQYVDYTQDDQLLDQAQMLTGDENVVNVSMAVQYLVKPGGGEVDFLFNFRSEAEIERVLQDLSEAALRQAVGDNPIDAVLTEGKARIRDEIEVRLQELCDLYTMGVEITAVELQDVRPPEEVRDAFQNVASAREEREKLINLAEAYESEQLPQAEGQVRKIGLEAEGYYESRIAEAEGDVARFIAISQEFGAAPEVTRSRLYLETMSELLPRTKVTIIDEEAGVLNLKSLDGGNALPQMAGGDE